MSWEEVGTIYFNLDKDSEKYSKEWEFCSTKINYGKREIEHFYRSRWNSLYDKKIVIGF